MTVGAGTTGAGTTPYGTGTPAGSQGRVGKPFPLPNGLATGSRRIDPLTRDFVIDSNGHYVGMDDSQQLVLLAMMTTLGSCCVPGVGTPAPSGVIGDDFVARRKRDVTNALAPHVKSKRIEIISIDVNTSANPVLTRIRWRDLTKSLEQTLSI